MNSCRSCISIIGWATLLLVFDNLWRNCVHTTLHQMSDSYLPILRRIGNLHTVYHQYLDRNFDVHPEYYSRMQIKNNLIKNLILSSVYWYPLIYFPEMSIHFRLALVCVLVVYLTRMLGDLVDPTNGVDTDDDTRVINEAEYKNYLINGMIVSRENYRFHIANPSLTTGHPELIDFLSWL